MLRVVRQWWPILVAVTVIQIGNGLSGTLFSLEVDARGLPGWQTSVILSAFYAGSTAGAFLAPGVIKRIAHIAAIILFAAIAALSVTGLALSLGAAAYAVLRMGQGIGYSGFFAAIVIGRRRCRKTRLNSRALGPSPYDFPQHGQSGSRRSSTSEERP